MERFFDECIAVLKAEIEKTYGGNSGKAAEAWGISAGLLSQWLSGKRKPSLESLSPIFTALGVHLEGFEDNALDEFTLIPKVEAMAGAGSSLETSGETVGFYAFRRDFIGQQNINHDKSVLMTVIGDSMQPLLMDGDTILVDQADTEIKEGKIFVCTLGEELRVKRIFKSINGIILRSDNATYPDIFVAGHDFDNFRIHGRVRWFGRVI